MRGSHSTACVPFRFEKCTTGSAVEVSRQFGRSLAFRQGPGELGITALMSLRRAFLAYMNGLGPAASEIIAGPVRALEEYSR